MGSTEGPQPTDRRHDQVKGEESAEIHSWQGSEGSCEVVTRIAVS